MKDIQEDEEEEEDQTEEVSFVDKDQSFFTSFTDKALKNFQRVKLPIQLTETLSMSRRIFTHYADVVRDLYFLGWIGQLVEGGAFFLHWAFWSMVASFLVPFFLASLNLFLNPVTFNMKNSKITNRLILLAFYPVLPILVIILENKTLLELSFCFEDKIAATIKRYQLIKMQTAQFIRTELCIERTLQITFSVLLLVFSKSTTRTAQGLEAIFDQTEDSNESTLGLFGIPPELLLTLNNAWALYSAWNAYVRGMSSTKNHFPMSASLFLGLFVVLSVGLQCFTTIIFLAPTLGLMNVLRHYQGELFPYIALTDEGSGMGKKQSITDMVHFSNKDPFPWSDLTHFNYSNLAIPPPVTNYTYFSLKTCLYGYWILIVIQACLIMLAKKVTNPEVYQRQNWSQRITHALENSQIAIPMEDWDDQHGPIQSYVKAQKRVEKEMGVTLLIKLFFHFLMGIPIMILASNVSHRQEILERTTGPYPEETEAYHRVIQLAHLYPLIIISATCLQLAVYGCYNNNFHPFWDLIKDFKKHDEEEMGTEMQDLVRNEQHDSLLEEQETSV